MFTQILAALIKIKLLNYTFDRKKSANVKGRIINMIMFLNNYLIIRYLTKFSKNL